MVGNQCRSSADAGTSDDGSKSPSGKALSIHAGGQPRDSILTVCRRSCRCGGADVALGRSSSCCRMLESSSFEKSLS